MKYVLLSLLGTVFFLCSKSQDLLLFRLDSLYGYKDKQGIVKIEPQYQLARKFMDDMAVVTKNGKSGVIDKNNRLIIPFKYEYLLPVDTAEFFYGYKAVYYRGYSIGVITKDEKIIIPAGFSDIVKKYGRYIVTKQLDSVITKNSPYDIRSPRECCALFDSGGSVLIPCKYNSLRWINDSLLSADSIFQEDELTMNVLYALFNKKGQQLTSFVYSAIANFVEGVAKARISDKYGYIYPTGKIAIPIQFDDCESFNKGYALIKQNDKWGAINKEGKVVVESQFDYYTAKMSIEAIYTH